MEEEFVTIIESTSRNRGRIVLRKGIHDRFTPFVIHFYNESTQGYFWGDYCQDLVTALKIYVERCGREGVHLSPQCYECFEKLNGELGLIRIRFERDLKRIQEETRKIEEVTVWLE